MKKLEGKVALITSASRGIGLACALKMADEGARVFLGVRRVDDAQRLCEEHRTLGRDMRPVFFEATRTETYAGMVEETVRYGGGLNVLINNFGAGRPEDDLDLVRGSESAFFDLLQLKPGGVYRISKACRTADAPLRRRKYRQHLLYRRVDSGHNTYGIRGIQGSGEQPDAADRHAIRARRHPLQRGASPA